MAESYEPTVLNRIVDIRITGGVGVFCPDGIKVTDGEISYITGPTQVPTPPEDPTLEPTWPWVSIGGFNNWTLPNDQSVQTNDVRYFTPTGYYNKIKNTRTNLRPSFECPFISPELIQLAFGSASPLYNGSDASVKIGVGGDNAIPGTMMFWLRDDLGVDIISYQCHGWLRRNGDANLGSAEVANAQWMFEHDLPHGVSNVTIGSLQDKQPAGA